MLGATKGRMIRCTVPGLAPKSSGDLAHTGPSRSRQRLMDSFFQRGGYRRPPEAVFLIPDSRKPVTGPVLRPCPFLTASPDGAGRAVLERAGSRQSANRRGIDGIGPGHIRHRLARGKALQRLLALMRRHLARPAELDATVLRPLASFACPGADQLALELG